jgi:hypothetical protein
VRNETTVEIDGPERRLSPMHKEAPRRGAMCHDPVGFENHVSRRMGFMRPLCIR